MASEIRVNKINSRTGVGTITLSPTGVDFTGIATVATLKATTGIVTTLSATGNATVGGTLNVTGETTFATHINLGDSDKAIFGAGDDLQIYHDGSESVIHDNGTGQLKLRTNLLRVNNAADTESIATFNEDGAIKLYYDNSKRFETTGVGASVTGAFNVGTGTSITSSGLIVNDVQYPTAGPLSNRNLVINGAMQVAQRGTSSQTNGYGSLDRWHIQWDGGTVTHTQTAITSGSPYDEGFRNVLRLTNTANTNDAAHYRNPFQYIEAQNLAQSGWDYTSSSSYVTLSFWVRSSVAQQFYGYLRTFDGTSQSYSFSMGTLSADTWTKVTKTIPGNSNITINNDSGSGLQLNIAAYWGGNFTSSGNTPETWAAFSSGSRTPDFSNTWSNTTGATFDITGVQLEVGSKATPFEHRIYGDELARCQRYYQRASASSGSAYARCIPLGHMATNNILRVVVPLHPPMRAQPSFNFSGSFATQPDVGTPGLSLETSNSAGGESVTLVDSSSISGTVGNCISIAASNDDDAYMEFSAEL